MAELIMLRLEGVLQSWGESAAWDSRNTSDMPTRSGIVGLIAGAMGCRRDDPAILALSDALSLGVRADRRGIPLSDYQTIQGMPRIFNAEGKPRSSNTIISPREYLQDASFLVVIDTERTWRERIAAAFAAPAWCIYLGRKSCVPARPVWDGIHGEYADVRDALCRYPLSKRADDSSDFIYEVEQPFDEGNSFSRVDRLDGNRLFRKRTVWRGTVRRDAICT